MRVLVFDVPTGQLVKAVTSLRELSQELRTSWAKTPTDAELQVMNEQWNNPPVIEPDEDGNPAVQPEPLGLTARVSVETPAPTVEYGQEAVAGDEEQPDGTWLQTWTVQERFGIEEFRAHVRAAIVSLWWEKMNAAPTVSEVAGESGHYGPMMTARSDRMRPKLVAAMQNVASASTHDELRAVYENIVGA